MRFDTILPAGGRIHGEFAASAGQEIKALIELSGQTVLERTLETLKATGLVERTVVIGPDEVAAHPCARCADAVLPEGDSGPANILRGLEWLRESNGGKHAERVLILTTDLPFVTPESLVRFVDACPEGIDICLPVVRREDYEASFPGSGNTYVNLRDGQWTLGCAFLVNPEAIARNQIHIERVFAGRKSQLAMARLLGIPFVLRLFLRQLGISHIEERCRELLGCACKGVAESAPELAFDIDRPQDYEYAIRRYAGLPEGDRPHDEIQPR